MEIVLEVEKLVKNYGLFRAVDSISFVVPKGKVIGFLGPNGAGKTTTIQILLGITLKNGGTIKYFGRDFTKHRQYCLQRINFSSAFNTLLGRITVWENLLVYAGLYEVTNPKKKIMELIDYFDSTDLLSELYQNLSSGQKTRINFVKALLNDPELLLMDEPTASLDPDIADKTLTLIESLRKSKNLSILYTSHNMDEITRICDEVIFLDHGKIVAHDTPLNLTKKISGVQLLLKFYLGNLGNSEVKQYLDARQYQYSFPNMHTVLIDTKENIIPKLIFDLSNIKIDIVDIEIKKPTLEDVFLQIARGDTNVDS